MTSFEDYYFIFIKFLERFLTLILFKFLLSKITHLQSWRTENCKNCILYLKNLRVRVKYCSFLNEERHDFSEVVCRKHFLI